MAKEKNTETGMTVAEPTPAQVPAKVGGGVKVVEGYDAVVESGEARNQSEYMQSINEIDKAIQDNVAVGEIQVSRISIAQPSTPEVASKVQGWESGQLFDSMSREVITTYGKPPWLLARGVDPSDVKATHYLPIVFIFKLPNEYVKWPDKEERDAGMKNFHWKSLDPGEPRVREGLWKPKGTWRGEGSPPVTEHINLLAIGLDTDCSPRTNLIVASFSRTSFRTGQKLVTSLSQHKMTNLPYWGRVYYLFTESHTEDILTWYTIGFAKGPNVTKFGVEAGGDDENNRALIANCFKYARDLANPNTGRELQELMINAAAFAADDAGDGGSAGGESAESTADPTF